MKRLLLFVFLLPFTLSVQAQHGHSHPGGRVIQFPDTADHLSLTCDFHMHTVFSDGSVWPDIRVQEALRDGIDCIAMTEHLEYQPRSADIPHPDRNRAFDLATRYAEGTDLIVIPGSEITRSLPYGHANSIFLQDANLLLQEDAEDAYAEAAAQGGFTFINHPNWTSQRKDGVARLQPEQLALIDRGQIHGIEVVNDLTYSDEALELAIAHNLTIIGTSDIHGLVDWQYEIAQGGHRPVTIVFAEERTPEAIHQALRAGRTVAYYLDFIIGLEEHMMPLLSASLHLEVHGYQGDSSIARVTISNSSDAWYTLRNASAFRFHDRGNLLDVPPHHSVEFLVKTGERLESIDLSFEVLNAVTAPATHPVVTLSGSVMP
ncbi:MAG: Sb-PDE family phosphodiesterase [Bacteroidota bacterium]|nr:Sb-PDE family phosphodiesterase [Bacteroidota bacterium]